MNAPYHRTDPPTPDGNMAALTAAIRRHHLRGSTTEQDRALLAATQPTRLPGGRNNAAYRLPHR
jgi:hypothetical protein